MSTIAIKLKTKVTSKFNNNIRKALAHAHIKANLLAEFAPFRYEVDWSNFPNSLMIECPLKPLARDNTDNPASTTLQASTLERQLIKILQFSLLQQGIKFRDIRKNIKLIQDFPSSSD